MTTMELDAMRNQLARTILETEDMSVLQRVRRVLQRATDKVTGTYSEYAADDQTGIACEEGVEYISKQEILDGIREGLTEVYRAQRTGEKLKTLQEVIDELD